MSQDYTVQVRLNADGTGVVTESGKAATGLDKVSQAADRVTKSFGATFAAAEKHTQATEDETVAIGKLEAELSRLLGRLDPAQKQINQLTEATSLLTAAESRGLLSKQQYAEWMKQANAAYGESADAAGKSAFATAGVRRELLVLGHEAVTGNFSRMPGSFMVLAERADLSAVSLGAVAVGIAAVAVVAGTMAKAFADGHHEMEQMNNALSITGNFAGMTRGSMNALAGEISKTSTLTIGTSKDVVTAIVASGRYSADNVAKLSQLVDGFARASGESASKVTPELIKMFTEPAKASEALNQQYHFLTAAQLQHIQALENEGRHQQAVGAALDAAIEPMNRYKVNLGYIEEGWVKAKKAFGEYMDKARSIGREPTAQDALAIARANVERLSNPTVGAGARASGTGMANDKDGAAFGSLSPARREAALAAARAELEIAERQAAVELSLAKSAADKKQSDMDRLAAAKEIERSQTNQITLLEQMKAKVKGGQADPNSSEETQQKFEADKARRLYEINKQIADIRRGMGAESATIENQRIANELQLREVTLRMAAEQNDAALKLGQINQADHDRTRTWLELQKNTMQQIAVEEQMNIANRTAAEKAAMREKLDLLRAQAVEIQQKGTNQVSIDDYNAKKAQEHLVFSMVDGINKLGDADIKRLQQSIAAQRLHNAEIGKSKELVERAKQAAEDVGTAELQTRADALAAMLAETQANEDLTSVQKEAIDTIYVPMLAQLREQIALRRTLAGELGTGAALEKQAEGTRAQQAEFQRMWGAVEQTGKTVFAHLVSGGTGAAQAIGQAFKSGVVDLLYQLTARPFMIQVGASIAGSLGISTAASAASGLGGLGGMGNGLSGIGNLLGLGDLPGFGTALGNFGSSFSTFSSLMGEGVGMIDAASAALAGMGPSFLSVLGPAGLALGAASMLGLFDGGGPKASDAFLQGGPATGYAIGINNAAGGDPDMNMVRAFNAALNDPTKFDPAVLASLVGTSVTAGGPADTAALIQQLTSALGAAASSAQNLAQKQAQLAQAQQAETQITANLQGAMQGLSSKLGIDALTAAKNGLAISDYNSPLDRVKAAQDLLDTTYQAAVGGDLTAVQSFPQRLQDALTVARDAYASGPQFQQIMAEDNAKLNDLLTRQQSVQADILKDVPLTIQQAANDQITALRAGFGQLVDQLTKLRADIRALQA